VMLCGAHAICFNRARQWVQIILSPDITLFVFCTPSTVEIQGICGFRQCD
jgi:hypothetical protein